MMIYNIDKHFDQNFTYYKWDNTVMINQEKE